MVAIPAQAHSREELDEWVTEWVLRADDTLNAALFAEWDDMRERHPYYFDPQPVSRSSSVYRGSGGNVEQWRELVAVYFAPGDVDTALCLMSYESGGNPDAYNSSGASGLMQILASWAPKFGVSREALFDPATNLWIASELRKISWNQWNPYKRGLCH